MIPIRCAGKAFLIREDAKVSAPLPPTAPPSLLQSLLKVKCALPQRKRLVSGDEQGWYGITGQL